MKYLVQTFTLLTFLVLGVAPAFATDDYLPSTKTLQQSGVSVEHIQALQTVRQNAKKEVEPLKLQMKQQRKALMDYLASPNATEPEALKMQQQLQGTINQLSELHVKTWFQMRKYLSPEQLKTLLNARQTRLAEGRKQWHDKRKAAGEQTGGTTSASRHNSAN